MKKLLDHINSLAEKNSSVFFDLQTRMLFIRAVLLYFMVKIILAWQASLVIEKITTLPYIKSIPLRILFLPGILFEQHPELFLIIGISICCISIWKPNLVSTILLFWYALNYYRVHFALAYGADIVLVSLIFLSIGLSVYPFWKQRAGFQKLLFNGTSFIIKIQIAIIYLLSGVDKLYAPAWRSGEAIRYMTSLDYLFNPGLVGAFPTTPWLNFILSWVVILFEILFPILIWNNRFRLWLLALGTVFHLAIVLLLSLIDFGFIMIISYIIFLQDSDLKKISGLSIWKFKPTLF